MLNWNTDELDVLVTELELSQRTLGPLLRDYARRHRLDYAEAAARMRLAEVLSYTLEEVRDLRYFGARSLAELQECLAARGVELTPTPTQTRGRFGPACAHLREAAA